MSDGWTRARQAEFYRSLLARSGSGGAIAGDLTVFDAGLLRC